jgi:micrococcal nuclease
MTDRIRLAILGLMVAVMGLILAGESRAWQVRDEDEIPEEAVQVELVYVVDGDTFDVDLDLGEREEIERVRMIGIDTPETGYSFGTEPECYGEQATRKAESVLVAAEEIWLERDVRDSDQHGRLLRYVWFVSHVDGKVYLLNEVLVAEGFAEAKTYRPDVTYQDRLDAAEERAIRGGRGMWLTCDASVSLDPDLEDRDAGPNDVPIDRTLTPVVDEEAACSFFETWDEAYEFYLVFQELEETLDPDGAGIPCGDYFGVDEAP